MIYKQIKKINFLLAGCYFFLIDFNFNQKKDLAMLNNRSRKQKQKKEVSSDFQNQNQSKVTINLEINSYHYYCRELIKIKERKKHVDCKNAMLWQFEGGLKACEKLRRCQIATVEEACSENFS
jgi:hypothetical protein